MEDEDLRKFFNLSLDILCIGDTMGNLMSVNPAFTRVLGWSDDDISYKTIPDLVHEEDRDKACSMLETLIQGRPSFSFECRMLRKDGSYSWLQWRSQPSDDGKLFYGVLRDITVQKNRQNILEERAHYDVVTSLPNRYLFLDHAERVLAQANREHRPVSMFFIDLDEFKSVNDEYGHDIGDELLRETAERFKSAIREYDMLARFAGDEFIALITIIQDEDDVHAIAARLIGSLAKPFELSGYKLIINASIGVAVFPDHGVNAEDLIKHADTAMYIAKKEGGACYKIYESGELDEETDYMSA